MEGENNLEKGFEKVKASGEAEKELEVLERKAEK